MRISKLKILKGIPFNADDKVVLTFDSIESQYMFFNRHTIATYNNTSFIRGFYNKKIKIDVDFNEIKYANYVMFKNDDLEDEGWNYAYITNIEYISDNCTHIEIEMDYFQTYMGQIVFAECQVERMMPWADDPELNYLWKDEPEISYLLDNYVITGDDEINFNNFKICVCYKPNLILESLSDTTNISNTQLSGTNQVAYRDYRSGSYSQYFNRGFFIPDKYISGCAYRIYEISNDANFKAITNDIWQLETFGYTILSIYVIPSEFDIMGVYQRKITLNGSKNPYLKEDKEIKIFNGYEPINKKCYTSPYMYLELSNRQGDIRKFQYQHFSRRDDEFTLVGSFVNRCNAFLFPDAYKLNAGISIKELMYDYGVPIKEMPTCQWNESLANAVRTGIGMIKDAAIAVATGGASLPSSFANLIKGTSEHFEQFLDPTTKGVEAMPILQLLLNCIGWTFRQYTTANIIEIDDYFSTYGYRIDIVDSPNILGNRRFNYVKTKQAIIRGDIPINARNDIIDKLNNGITFWHDLTNFNYGSFRGIYSNEIVDNDLTDRGTIF